VANAERPSHPHPAQARPASNQQTAKGLFTGAELAVLAFQELSRAVLVDAFSRV
jgi:hypothetical protein